jgi:asparagine synthase (glutamine-hydrolysing)
MVRTGVLLLMNEPVTHPTEVEVAIGVRGTAAEGSPIVAPTGTARSVLEGVIARELADGSAIVSFSGGRDSSAVLAVGVHVARKYGLPLPRPAMLRYPGDQDSDETEWQELVLHHLGIDDPIIIDVVDRATYLDEHARASLRRRGLLFPPALHLRNAVLPAAAGGVLLTGEGGDEVLGTRRITPLTLLARYHRRPSRGLLRWALSESRPLPLRARAEASADASYRPWLTQKGRRLLLGAARDDVRAPLHWGRETHLMARRRASRELARCFQSVADDHDVQVRHPLLAPEFLAALAAEGGRWGFAGRTDLMRHLFSDLLPDSLLARSTKAHFGAVRWGATEREFAERWDGSGLPEDLIDPERIREEWLSERPGGVSVLPLHAAWLHSEGLSWEGQTHD